MRLLVEQHAAEGEKEEFFEGVKGALEYVKEALHLRKLLKQTHQTSLEDLLEIIPEEGEFFGEVWTGKK